MTEVELKPSEVCPYCGQRRRKPKTMTEKAVKANQINGKTKGGRPKKAEKEK